MQMGKIPNPILLLENYHPDSKICVNFVYSVVSKTLREMPGAFGQVVVRSCLALNF